MFGTGRFPMLVVPLSGLLFWAPARATAQRLAPAYLRDTVPSWTPPGAAYRDTAATRHPDAGGMVVAGVTAGAVGLFAGAYAGGALGGGNRICGDDPCGLEGALWGAVLGESVVLPLGVHLAGGRRGNYGTELVTSVVIATGGVLLAYASGSGIPLLAVPIAQLASGIAIEARARATR
jgi:hypothetical protein